MKKRVLVFGVPASHESISVLPNFSDALSISDYDAFVFDPLALQNLPVVLTSEDYNRRLNELRDLMALKGGIILCLLRPKANINVTNVPGLNNYDVLNAAAPSVLPRVTAPLRAGTGSSVELTNARGPSAGYFQVLKGVLRFTAYIDTATANLEGVGGTVFATDSIGHPVAVEFISGAGRICFFPVPEGIPGDRLGAAIARVVEVHYGGPSEIDAPEWSRTIDVPGATANDARIKELAGRKAELETEIAELAHRRAEILNYRLLLYGYGKSVLEPIVRSALRLLGFRVPEPDEYKGEWDVELYQPLTAETAIGEVEGSTGIVDVEKYRQLLDYIQAEILEARDHKGILIGNGYRLKPLDAPERQRQFSDHALRGAAKNGYCLLPTTELFKAVCAVLEAPNDEALKISIRKSILATVGVWTFIREARESLGTSEKEASSNEDRMAAAAAGEAEEVKEG